MVEQETQVMKVYELAKELGIDSISLLDKLNNLNIRVKNHMSDLGPDDVRAAKSALGKKEAAKDTKKAAPRTRKKAAASTDEAAPTATKAATSKATTTRTVTRSARTAAAAPAPEPTAAEKKAAAPVIRRRTKEGGATETVIAGTGAPLRGAGAEAHPTEPVYETEGTEAEAEQMEADAQHAQQQTEQESGGEAEASAEAVQASSAEAAQGEAESAAATAGAGTQAAGTSTDAGASAKASRAPIVLPPRPVAPRKSILKIVDMVAPPPRPMVKPVGTPGVSPVVPKGQGVKGVATQDKDGFRIIKMTKENLDAMVEEEAAKKRGGGGREAEIRPEDVRFADYRKKEMVFLPKKKRIPIGKELKRTQKTVASAKKRVVEMQETISIQDLANQLSVKAVDVVRKLMGMGQMATINQSIDFDTATLVGAEYQYEVRNVAFNEEALLDVTSQDKPEDLQPRPPVVTIMGHVDHGKTSLLDAIREANVAGGEAGGITQHIGAYTVEKDGKLISFIDTPGHEAFTVMRARGANVTDIVILVVAADDGVMPQTREALSHAQAANVPIIVAMNKIDKPGANPEKIKQQLAELNLLAEDWGGQTMFVPVSAIKRTNLDKLLESILLQAEVLDLKANPNAKATGTVLEARLEKGRGPMASVLIRRGTLRVGDPIVSGTHSGKVKAMMDDKGRVVKEALPGFAVEVLGFESLPNAGERMDVATSEIDARTIAENRSDKVKAAQAAPAGSKISLDDLFSKIQTGTMKELGVIVKADVFGSVEAIRDSLLKLSNEKVKVKILMAAPGGITESDVLLATASNALIIGFNVRPETKARQLAEAEHIEIRSYQIIYELIEDVKKAMTGLLDKKKVEKFLGRAEVRQTFSVPKIGMVAGTAVIDGKIIRGANVRLLRDSRIIYDGKMTSLRRFKDDAKEVASGYECGIGLENFNDVKPGDVIEAYQIEMIAPELNS